MGCHRNHAISHSPNQIFFKDTFVSHPGGPNEQFGTHEKLSWGSKVTLIGCQGNISAIKMDALFQSRYNCLSKVQIQMAQPSILKSHKRSKMIETHFYRLYSIMTGSKNHCWLSLKSMAPNFVAVVSVLLPFCGQICQGMPYVCIF